MKDGLLAPITAALRYVAIPVYETYCCSSLLLRNVIAVSAYGYDRT
jgi:hypothetical protein